ncbi:MAG: asparagine synthase (glutamine-hydrolyzing) [Anaerolineae bacterium]|nr:asparagine synthase (glutamine-hydrolyzing) [Anaerolineae bacterium]
MDRFGKKPLYYLLDAEKVIFASELKAILQHPGLRLELDPAALDAYLYLGYVPAPLTIFRQIRKLPPAHLLRLHRDGTLTQTEYWQPRFVPPAEYDLRPAAELAADLRQRLLAAVRLRMVSEVPLGAFLSGGVDSSAVVALMSQVSTQPVKTYAIGFEDSAFDETHYAQQVATFCRTDHTREVVRPDVVTILPQLIHQFDEPFADSSMIPTYYVSWAARQHVTVALSGDGGDEVFAGYHRYRNVFRHRLVQRFIPPRLRPAAGAAAGRLPDALKIGRYVQGVAQPALEHWSMQTEFFTAAQRQALLAAPPALSAEDHRRRVLAATAGLDWLAQYQTLDIRTYMAGDILVKVDRASMLASLEVRCPLLDQEVFEFMARVPPWLRMTQQDSKILLKQALHGLLPPAIFTRDKRGFMIPLRRWLQQPLKPLLYDTLLDATARQRGLLQTGAVQRLITEHVSGQVDHQHRLWALLCLELWARDYL